MGIWQTGSGTRPAPICSSTRTTRWTGGRGRTRRSPRRRRRDVPVLLSVGYSACHWCHVMAHESFEDAATAALMNEHFVSIKVDREERPDVDAVYMAATQAMTGQGGWPMTVFLDPGRRAVLLPAPTSPASRVRPAGRRRSPQAWRADRTSRDRRRPGRCRRRRWPSIRPAAGGDAGAGRGPLRPARQLPTPRSQACASAVRRRCAAASAARPKFPPSMVLEFLLAPASGRRGPGGRSDEAAADGRGDPGGDGPGRHVRPARRRVRPVQRRRATGWCRTSRRCCTTTRCSRVYAHWWRPVGRDRWPPGRRETCDFMLRELGTAEGGFASALDADSEGVEGTLLRLDPCQLSRGPRGRRRRVGRGDLRRDPGGHLRARQLDAPAAGRPGRRRTRCAEVRAPAAGRPRQRVRPARDDKVVAAWNGLAIAGLAEAGLPARPSRLRRGGARRRPSCWPTAPRRRPAAAGLARRRRAGAAPACSRTTAASRPGFLALCRRPASPLARPPPASCWTTALDRFARPGRRLLRHGRRRRARWSPARPTRPTTPARPGAAVGRGAALLRRADRLGAAPRGRGRALGVVAESRARLPGPSAGGWPWPRRCSGRPARDRGGRPGRGRAPAVLHLRTATGRSHREGDRGRRVRPGIGEPGTGDGEPGTGDSRTGTERFRCSPAAAWWTAGPAAYVCRGISPAVARHRLAASCARSSLPAGSGLALGG